MHQEKIKLADKARAPRENRRRFNRWWIVYAGVALAGGVILWFTMAKPVVVLPRMNLAPGYIFTTADGGTLNSENGRGVVTLYSFAYTRCGVECEPLYDILQTVDHSLTGDPPRDPPLRFVTLTLDPAYDTPERLAGFARPFQPQAVEWIWMTGTEERVKAVAGGGFEVLYQSTAEGVNVLESHLVLVDGFGVVRADLDPQRAEPESVVAFIDLLYEEIATSHGAARLAYEAAHFFACYP